MKNILDLKTRKRQIAYCKSLTSKKTISKPGKFIGSYEYESLSMNQKIDFIDGGRYSVNQNNHLNNFPHEIKDV